MPLEDISLHIDALGRDHDEVDGLCEDIVRSTGVSAAVSTAHYRMGGEIRQEHTPDGPQTLMHLGTAINTEFIIYVAPVPAALAKRIREDIGGILLVLDPDFQCNPEDPPDVGDGDDDWDDDAASWLPEITDWENNKD